MREYRNPTIGLNTKDTGIDTGNPVSLELPIPSHPSPRGLPQEAARLLATVQVKDSSDRVLKAKHRKQNGFSSYPVGSVRKPICQRGVGL